MARRKNYKKNGTSGQSSKNTTNKPASSGTTQQERGSTDSKSGEDKADKNSESTSDKSGNTTNAANDPAWYTKFPELAMGAGNIPFSDRLGDHVSIGDLDVQYDDDFGFHITAKSSNMYNDAIPGVCSVRTKPSYGSNSDMNSPLNIAATDRKSVV